MTAETGVCHTLSDVLAQEGVVLQLRRKRPELKVATSLALVGSDVPRQRVLPVFVTPLK